MKAVSQTHCQCPECDSRYRIKQEMVGRKAKCKCGYVGTIPAPPVPAGASPGSAYELDLPEAPPPRVAPPAASPPVASIPGFESPEEAGQAAQRSRRARLFGVMLAVVGVLAFFLAPLFTQPASSIATAYLILGAVWLISWALVGVSAALFAVAKGVSPWWRLAGLGWFLGLLAVALLPDRHAILRESEGDPKVYQRLVQLRAEYLSVPWFRRGGVVGLLVLLGAFLFGLALIPACLIVLTGPVYHPPKAKHQRLEPWHWGNQVAAYLLLGFWLLIYLRACS